MARYFCMPHIYCIDYSFMHTIGMDKFDKELLRHLQLDSSTSNAILGDLIGLSASQISRRRARLESDGIICGYRAEISASAIGLKLNTFIRVRLHTHDKSAASQFKTLVADLPQVRLACSITGDADYLLHVRLPDLDALSSFINDELLAHELVSEVRSDVVLDLIKDNNTMLLK